MASEFVSFPEVDDLNAQVARVLERADEVFWAGKHCPLASVTASNNVYLPELDHRMSWLHHQRYDLVYLTERDLLGVKQWPMVLDEALRLVKPGGYLLVRSSITAFAGIFEMQRQIREWSQSGARVVAQDRDHDDHFLTLLQINCPGRQVHVAGVSFGVITDGRSLESTSAFVESVRSMDCDDASLVEVIVCGPAAAEAELRRLTNHEFLWIAEPVHHRSLGWITRKKNLIAEHARHPHLVVAHDRYRMSRSFLRELRSFGGDFDVLVCRQTDAVGDRFPDWVTLGSDERFTKAGVLEYGDYHPDVYVNGGVFIVTTEVMRRIPLNELLFWGQGEDVEWTSRLKSRGITPRLARDVVASSPTSRPGYALDFDECPRFDQFYLSPQNPPNKNRSVKPVKFPIRFNLGRYEHREAASAKGLELPSSWRQTKDGFMWRGGGTPYLAVAVSEEVKHGVAVTVGFGTAEQVTTVSAIRINGLDAVLVCHPDDPKFATASVQSIVLRQGQTLRVGFVTEAPQLLGVMMVEFSAMPVDDDGGFDD